MRISDWSSDVCSSDLAAHGVNPASQPVLSRVPALTLAESYKRGDNYEYGRALETAATTVLGADLARRVLGDLLLLNDTGLDRLGGDRKSVVGGKRVSVRVDPGGRRNIKKNKEHHKRD